MNIRPTGIALAASLLALAACSGKPPAPKAADGTAATETKHVSTPWEGMEKDKQRAQDVQKTVDQQAAEQRKQLEAAEQ